MRRIRLSRSGMRRRTVADRFSGPAGPSGRDLFLQPADPVEHVVDPAAGGFLQDCLDHLAFPERIEHRRDRADLHRVGPEEHQVVEDPVELSEGGPQPDGPLWDLDPHQPLDREDEPRVRC